MLILKLQALAANINNQTKAFWAAITASDLGVGAVGAGNKYLADDMTWKTVTSGGGSTNSNVLIDGGSFTSPNENLLIDCGTFNPPS